MPSNNANPILLAGGTGQVGSEIRNLAHRKGYPLVSPESRILDISNEESVQKVMDRTDPSLVINAAAWTNVDLAETETESAFRINHNGPAHLARACRDRGIPLFQISTDYVFNGKNGTPYLEDDPACPETVYGRSKLLGEEAVKNLLQEYVTVRVSWVFGNIGSNFVKTVLRLAGQKNELKVVADQYGCPTFAADIADAVMLIAEHYFSGKPVQWGTYHFTGADPVTWFEFATAIVDIAWEKGLIHKKIPVLPISTDQFPTPASRPAFSVLDCSKIRHVFGIRQKDWQKGLERMLQEQRLPHE